MIILMKKVKIILKITKKYLELMNINYVVNDKLVRGLDYYSDTVFEIKI